MVRAVLQRDPDYDRKSQADLPILMLVDLP
jgi:hypothetical protein